MTTGLLLPLLIGILVFAAVYIALQFLFGGTSRTVQRAAVVFAAACGLLTTLWLRDNPNVLAEAATRIVAAAILVVLALLALARRALR